MWLVIFIYGACSFKNNLFWMLTPYQMYQQICSPILWVFILLMISFAVQNLLVWCSPIRLFFSFVSLVWGDTSDDVLLPAVSRSHCLCFLLAFLWIHVWHLRSVIHFEFILVCSVRRWSSFIFLHASVQFSQHCLLYKLYLVHSICSPPLPNMNWW